ncbi:MAG: threonine/serine dehydratase [Rhizomicrobium sp.]
MTVKLPTFADIAEAAAALAPYALETPLVEHGDLNERVGARVFLKLETFQRTGSFKFRGAFNRIRQIAPEDRAKGVVAFSSGNHAQGVAAAAALFSMPALIVMPKDVPAPKLEGTRALGAEVVFYDRRTDDREAIAQALCKERGATLVRPFDDFYVVAGQGTVGLEMARQAAARDVTLDAVLAPCSGGGLIGGIALAFAAASPATRIVSVEPECYDGMKRSLAAGHRVVAPGGIPSVADALMAPVPGEIPFALATRHLHDSLMIRDSEFLAGTTYAATRLKLLVEPSGAAGLAALISGRFKTFGVAIGVVLTGANCDIAMIAAAS